MAHHVHQSGQAIVIVGLMLTVLVGMVAISIDGARAYSERRELQSALDAAALAASDGLQQNRSYTRAEQAATSIFGSNLRLYIAPSCSPYGSPGASPFTVTCTYSDLTILTQVVSMLGPQGSQFAMTATRPMDLQFARILTNGVAPVLTATASGGVNNELFAPAVAALSQAGCGGKPGAAITVNGYGTLDVQGDVVSNGAISVTGGSVNVGGDIYSRCQSSISGSVTNSCYPSDTAAPCTFPNVAGATRAGFNFVDPGYPPPPVAGGGRGAPGADVVLMPGAYAADPVLNNNRCWFLSAGVYEWPAGLTNDGDFVSNELKPPSEPLDTNNTMLARRQFWNTNGVGCAGTFQLSSISGAAIRRGTWAVEITSTRTDTYRGVNYARESAPSYCQTVALGSNQAVQVQISNVPGATAYNVYAAPPPSGCAGPFGLAGSIPVTGPVRNDNTANCPDYTGRCSLGTELAVFDAALLGSLFAPNAMAAPGTTGAYPPDGEAAPLGFRQVNQNPDRAVPPRGDRANENQCDSVVGARVTCPGPITPGAVSIYIPAGGCLTDTNNGDNFVFSGYQFNWIAVYEPGTAYPPANRCPNLLDAASNSAYVGLFYTPTATVDIPTRAAFRTEATGGIMADKITFSGSLPLIVSSGDYAPVPPAARLVV